MGRLCIAVGWAEYGSCYAGASPSMDTEPGRVLLWAPLSRWARRARSRAPPQRGWLGALGLRAFASSHRHKGSHGMLTWCKPGAGQGRQAVLGARRVSGRANQKSITLAERGLHILIVVRCCGVLASHAEKGARGRVEKLCAVH